MAKASNRRHLESALSDAERAVDEARSQLADLQRSNKDLEARMRELEGELERRPPEAQDPETQDAGPDRDVTLRDALSREWQLARRVAELEASRAMEPPVSEAEDNVRALSERIDTLTLQLDAARAREDELAVRAVRAERTLAETGARLAALGQRADEADGLEAALAELRDAAAIDAEEAKEREAGIRLQLDEVHVRLTGLEVDLHAARTQADDAATEVEQAESRALPPRSASGTRSASWRPPRTCSATSRRSSRRSASAWTTPLPNEPTSPRRRRSCQRWTLPRADDEITDEAVEPSVPAVRYLEVGEVTAIADREYGRGAPADLAALSDVVAAPAALDEHGEPLFPGLHVKAAVLLEELIRRRPYLQGNRRIGLLVTTRFLEVNGLDVSGREDAMSELALAVEAGDVPLLSIAATLEALTVRRVDDAPGAILDVG